MQTQTLKQLYNFEIENLAKEINLYSNSKNLWITKENISNSGGNLALHIIGNLNHFIGATLLQTNYVRNREAEFADKNISKDILLEQLKNAQEIVNQAFDKMTEENLLKTYPYDFMGSNTTGFYITRFLCHLSYHLGQINYHRRLLDI
jgi:hypothetical protein